MIVDPRLDRVVGLLRERVADGTELGASLCVIRDGEVLLDVWAGWADRERTVAWQRDTLAPVWSISKTMTALAVWLLHDRGELDVDQPVATYWPEFGAHGKEAVTIAHVLSHSSGVPAWGPTITLDDILDWKTGTTDLAEQAPWWTPGTASGYHVLNQGHLLGEVIGRVTGLMPSELIERELARPLGADFRLGLDPADHDRVAELELPRMLPRPDLDPDGFGVRAFTRPFLHLRESTTARWRHGEVPAANGFGNARSVARLQALVSHGGAFDGHRVLTPASVERIVTPVTSGRDLVLDVDLAWGPGWALPSPAVMPSVPTGRRCFWGGIGGSVVVNDVQTRTTVAYVMNRLVFEYAPGTRTQRPCGDSRSDGYLTAIAEGLGEDA